MFRQRLRTRSSPLSWLGRALLLLVAAALVWYGLMLVLLALKVSPSTIDAISGYRTIFDALDGITSQDITGTVRAITAAAGVVLLLVCGYLAFKQLPRPYFARGDVDLSADERGTVTVEPRAIERVAEAAAASGPGVVDATGLFGGDELTVNVTAARARELADDLRGARERVREALDEHGLPAVPVNVTLTGFERRTRRELD